MCIRDSRDTARKIAADRLAPVAEKLDKGEGRAELLANLKELAENGFMGLNVRAESVSYTHLDVYKRQSHR